ncbi:hypothetical protein ACVWZR_003990 [Bradyrhizobium sp. i1.3.1]
MPAELGDVLAFYRTELSKLGWQEQRDGAVVSADHVKLAFASPLGPGMLALDRKDASTAVNLVQKNASVAANANVMPEPGQAKLVFSNISETEASLTINDRTIKHAAGAYAVSLDLQPGRYSYEVSVPGHPATTNILNFAAGRYLGAYGRARRRGMVAAPAVLNLPGFCRDFSSEAAPTVSQPANAHA